MEKRQRSFVSGAVILGIAGLIVKVIGAIFRIPLATLIDKEGMAYYETVYPYYSTLLVISSAGLPTAISKMVSERAALNDYRGAKRVFNCALVILAVIGTVTMLLMLLGANAFSSLAIASGSADDIAKQSMSFVAMAPSLLFVSLMCAYRGYLQGMQRMEGTAVSQVTEQVIKLVIGYSLAAYLLPMGYEYAAMGAILGVTASELMALIVIWAFYMRNKRHFTPELGVRAIEDNSGLESIVKRLAAIAIPVTIGASIMPITGIVDSIAIRRILMELGYQYEAANEMFSIFRGNVMPIINMPAVLTVAIAVSLVPAISAKAAERDARGVRHAANTGIKLAMIIGAPCAAGLFVLAEPIITMLYPRLTAADLQIADTLMKISAVGVLFLSLVQTTTGVIQGLGKPGVPVKYLAIGGVIKIASIIGLMFIPELNIAGAALSSVLCYAVAGVLDTVYLYKRTRIKVQWWHTFFKPIVSAVLMGEVVWLAYRGFTSLGMDTSATLLSVAVGAIVYGALAILLRMFDRHDLEFIPGAAKLQRLFGRKR
ncbi:MAG: polysaccharide biosynthesis protein [Clostridia bacterium]|nr:polysaccharide biosynthesis protein [Clostridia bacterium]